MSYVLSSAVVAGALASTVNSAEARWRRPNLHRPAPLHRTFAARPLIAASTFTGDPRYSALVVDAKTGRVLYEKNADEPRYPASVTKVMTLYLVFEDLERGRVSLDSRITMSAHCAAEAPSKLGLRPGQTIDVEGGIKALVTKSANDVACSFAENLEGSVSAFAERMTRKARALGMYQTVYRNASGLPNPAHVTSARDLVTLGRAIQDRFPRYYGYFGTRVYVYAGRPIANHNKLLGRVEGVDGIKTGYTNAAGFNLLTSVKSQGRSLVAVVMGGRTGPSRDAHMRELIALNLPKAVPGSRTAPLVAEAGERAAPVAARPILAGTPAALVTPVVPAPERIASISAQIPAPTPVPSVAPTFPLQRPAPRAVAIEAQPVPAPAPALQPAPTPGSMRWVVGRQPTVTGSVPTASDQPDDETAAEALPEAPEPRPERTASMSPTQPAAEPAPAARRGWIIQIGATTEASQAESLLSDARAKGGRLLTSADPYTEVYTRGATTYYRARFAGLSEQTADAACKTLKRSSVSCFAIKN